MADIFLINAQILFFGNCTFCFMQYSSQQAVIFYGNDIICVLFHCILLMGCHDDNMVFGIFL